MEPTGTSVKGTDVDRRQTRTVMSGTTASCSHCSKQLSALQRCSRCKQASYCGAACQHAAWKGHKKTCVTLNDVIEKVNAAAANGIWREVIKWEGRSQEMMENRPDAGCENVLQVFAKAQMGGLNETGNSTHALSVVGLEKRRVEVLGRMQRFRDQGDAMCNIGDHLVMLRRRQESSLYFQRARNLGQAHGFLSIECTSCLGLGRLAMAEGRTQEGLDLLRNALVCAPLSEGDHIVLELRVLQCFTDALFRTHAIDEVELMISRYREAATAKSDTYFVLHSLYVSARLHEVSFFFVTLEPRVKWYTSL